MAPAEPSPPRGLRISDLIGLVVGYGLAALLCRSLWPRSRPLTGPPAIFFGLVFLWLGLAMSGPILLPLERRGGASRGARPPRPTRPGRLISEVPVLGRNAAPPRSEPEPPRYTRAELAWLLIGGYWITMAMILVPARSGETPWMAAGLLQLVAAAVLFLFAPGRASADRPRKSWTNAAASSLLWTWPIAWALMILLSRSL